MNIWSDILKLSFAGYSVFGVLAGFTNHIPEFFGLMMAGLFAAAVIGMFQINKSHTPGYWTHPIYSREDMASYFERECAVHLYLGDQKKSDAIWDMAMDLNLPVDASIVEDTVYEMQF